MQPTVGPLPDTALFSEGQGLTSLHTNTPHLAFD